MLVTLPFFSLGSASEGHHTKISHRFILFIETKQFSIKPPNQKGESDIRWRVDKPNFFHRSMFGWVNVFQTQGMTIFSQIVLSPSDVLKGNCNNCNHN